MNKMTKAAELYLKNYYILNEARKEMDQFLDQLLDRVYDGLSLEIENLNEEDYEWYLWKNKSSPGTIQLGIRTLKPLFDCMRTNKADIFVQYDDIRHALKLADPKSIEINVFCHQVSKGLKQELTNRSMDMFGSEITNLYYHAIYPESIDKTAVEIVNQMIGHCQKINQIVESLRRA